MRIALGATSASVMQMIVVRGLASTSVGLLIGLCAAWAATRTMKSLLYGVTPTDPATVANAVALLAAVALTACATPAFRASRVDPIVVLREE